VEVAAAGGASRQSEGRVAPVTITGGRKGNQNASHSRSTHATPATPTFYIIDHQGTIRRKWTGNPGHKTIDTALDKLIQEAERAKK
jgi:hypothetical protein